MDRKVIDKGNPERWIFLRYSIHKRSISTKEIHILVWRCWKAHTIKSSFLRMGVSNATFHLLVLNGFSILTLKRLKHRASKIMIGRLSLQSWQILKGEYQAKRVDQRTVVDWRHQGYFHFCVCCIQNVKLVFSMWGQGIYTIAIHRKQSTIQQKHVSWALVNVSMRKV